MALEREGRTVSSHSALSPLTAGMGLPTVSAARIYKGQLAGGSGEESILAMETFPHVALAKVSRAVLGGGHCAAPSPTDLCSPADLHHRPAGA